MSSFLNNSGDYVVLFDSAGNVVDQYQYTSDPGRDIAIGRSPDGTGEFQILDSATKGQPNSSPQSTPTEAPTTTPIPATPTYTPTPTKTPTSTPTPRTPTPTKTPTPTPSPKTPTPTKTPTPIKSSPTPKPSDTPAVKPKSGLISQKITGKSAPTSILGISTNSATIKPSQSKSKPQELVKSSLDMNSPFLIITVAGSILLIACAILIALRIKNKKKAEI